MPYRVLILGLPRSMTYWTAAVLGYDHDVTAWPVESPKPGLCDTGFALLPPEKQAQYFDAETKFVRLRRPEEDVLASLLRHFPDADPVAFASALSATTASLDEFFKDRPHLELSFPLTPASLTALAAYLDRKDEFLDWCEQLATRRDRLTDPAVLAACNQSFSLNT